MSNRKKINKAIRAKHSLEVEKQQNPDWCYCQKTEWETDNPIGETEPIDGFPYHNSKGYTQTIYRCNTCGKKFVVPIVFA
jgi:hypothetical protein